MFGRGMKLFKLFGFEVKIDASWLILGLLITWSLARGWFPNVYKELPLSSYWAMGAAGAVGLFFSIVFHELWHSLVARRFGLKMSGITLFIFGGVSEMTEEPASPKAEFFMAVAGPASSVVLGLGCLGLRSLASGWGASVPVTGVLGYLGFINLILAGFNLLPAFPLDGGRVLRSILWGSKGNLRWATRIAAGIGEGFGILLIIVGAFGFITGNLIGGVWTFLIGMFLRSASQSSYRQLLLRRALEGEKVRKFMVAEPVTVSSSTTIDDVIANYIYRYHFKMYPVVDGGRLSGCVTLDQVKEIPADERSRRTVGEIARGCSAENTIGPEEDVMKALSLMARTNRSRLLVTEGGRLAGVIALKDIMGFLSIKMDLEGR
jgi:Zn-dependent protease/predicted transcriptional regulator